MRTKVIMTICLFLLMVGKASAQWSVIDPTNIAAAFACWFHHLCCRQAPGSLLSFGLSHRPGQRSSLPSLPQHVY